MDQRDYLLNFQKKLFAYLLLLFNAQAAAQRIEKSPTGPDGHQEQTRSQDDNGYQSPGENFYS